MVITTEKTVILPVAMNVAGPLRGVAAADVIVIIVTFLMVRVCVVNL